MTSEEGFIELDQASTALMIRLRSRFRGALLGLALGEALAAPTVLRRAGSFAPVRDLLGGGAFDLPRGAWGDDTAMAICLAHSLLECNACDPVDQLRRYRSWQCDGEYSATGECLGITAGVSRALADGAPDITVADGSELLARTAPLSAFYLADDQGLLLSVETTARVTHHDCSGIEVAQTFASLMQSALRGAAVPQLCVRFESASGLQSSAGRMLARVMQAFCATTQWKHAVLDVINDGGDSDVAGAVCGQLAGACYGVEGLPVAWLNALHGREQLEGLADRMLAAVLLGEQT